MRKSDVYIGRRNNRLKLPESIWHNPFVIGKAGTRAEVNREVRNLHPGQAGAARPTARSQGEAAGMLLRAATMSRPCFSPSWRTHRDMKGDF
jgi:hypothetical protein